MATNDALLLDAALTTAFLIKFATSLLECVWVWQHLWPVFTR